MSSVDAGYYRDSDEEGDENVDVHSPAVDIKVVHAAAGRRLQFTQKSGTKPRATKASEAMAARAAARTNTDSALKVRPGDRLTITPARSMQTQSRTAAASVPVFSPTSAADAAAAAAKGAASPAGGRRGSVPHLPSASPAHNFRTGATPARGRSGSLVSLLGVKPGTPARLTVTNRPPMAAAAAGETAPAGAAAGSTTPVRSGHQPRFGSAFATSPGHTPSHTPAPDAKLRAGTTPPRSDMKLPAKLGSGRLKFGAAPSAASASAAPGLQLQAHHPQHSSQQVAPLKAPSGGVVGGTFKLPMRPQPLTKKQVQAAVKAEDAPAESAAPAAEAEADSADSGAATAPDTETVSAHSTCENDDAEFDEQPREEPCGESAPEAKAIEAAAGFDGDEEKATGDNEDAGPECDQTLACELAAAFAAVAADEEAEVAAAAAVDAAAVAPSESVGDCFAARGPGAVEVGVEADVSFLHASSEANISFAATGAAAPAVSADTAAVCFAAPIGMDLSTVVEESFFSSAHHSVAFSAPTSPAPAPAAAGAGGHRSSIAHLVAAFPSSPRSPIAGDASFAAGVSAPSPRTFARLLDSCVTEEEIQGLRDQRRCGAELLPAPGTGSDTELPAQADDGGHSFYHRDSLPGMPSPSASIKARDSFVDLECELARAMERISLGGVSVNSVARDISRRVSLAGAAGALEALNNSRGGSGRRAARLSAGELQLLEEVVLIQSLMSPRAAPLNPRVCTTAAASTAALSPAPSHASVALSVSSPRAAAARAVANADEDAELDELLGVATSMLAASPVASPVLGSPTPSSAHGYACNPAGTTGSDSDGVAFGPSPAGCGAAASPAAVLQAAERGLRSPAWAADGCADTASTAVSMPAAAVAAVIGCASPATFADAASPCRTERSGSTAHSDGLSVVKRLFSPSAGRGSACSDAVHCDSALVDVNVSSPAPVQRRAFAYGSDSKARGARTSGTAAAAPVPVTAAGLLSPRGGDNAPVPPPALSAQVLSRLASAPVEEPASAAATPAPVPAPVSVSVVAAGSLSGFRAVKPVAAAGAPETAEAPETAPVASEITAAQARAALAQSPARATANDRLARERPARASLSPFAPPMQPHGSPARGVIAPPVPPPLGSLASPAHFPAIPGSGWRLTIDATASADTDVGTDADAANTVAGRPPAGRVSIGRGVTAAYHAVAEPEHGLAPVAPRSSLSNPAPSQRVSYTRVSLTAPAGAARAAGVRMRRLSSRHVPPEQPPSAEELESAILSPERKKRNSGERRVSFREGPSPHRPAQQWQVAYCTCEGGPCACVCDVDWAAAPLLDEGVEPEKVPLWAPLALESDDDENDDVGYGARRPSRGGLSVIGAIVKTAAVGAALFALYKVKPQQVGYATGAIAATFGVGAAAASHVDGHVNAARNGALVTLLRGIGTIAAALITRAIL